MDTNCIFCKIIKGEIPAVKIYEDDSTFAFLDIMPVNEGHTLVIPKKHVPYFYDIQDNDYTALMQTVKKISKAVEKSIKPAKVGLLIKGFDVNHAHVHIIPLHADADIQSSHKPSKKEANDLQKIAKTIISSL